jgi:epsilon-lactone hydrolase
MDDFCIYPDLLGWSCSFNSWIIFGASIMGMRNRIIKKLIAVQMAGWSEGTMEDQRAKQELMSKYSRIPGEWISPPDADFGVILYLHGGAYALSSITVYREFLSRLTRATNLRCLAINYRLAPEDPFPAALEDAIAAYSWLQSQGFDPSQIIIAGDSAGGGLTLATLLTLRDTGAQFPAGAICISPWVDLALTGKSVQSKATLDPILDQASLQMYAGYYAGENDFTNPLISPLYANLEGLPPLLIHVGTDEILLDDATRFAEKARSAGVDVTLKIWDEMFHVFCLIPFLPETKQMLMDIVCMSSEKIRHKG